MPQSEDFPYAISHLLAGRGVHVSSRIDSEIRRAVEFGDRIEGLVVAKKQCPTGDRNTPLMAYWSLAFELQRGILCLVDHKFAGAAFALVRPLVEAAVRAHVVTMGSEKDLQKLHKDEYRTNFSTIGKDIDTAFGMDGLFQNFLDGAKEALHGYTHAGLHQLGRRFSGTDLVPNYSEAEILEVIRTSTSAVFVVNNLVTKHLGFEEEWKENTPLFDEWGKHD